MKKEVIQILEKYHQEHLLNYANLLSEEQEKQLEEQILRIDFEQLNTLYKETQKEKYIEEKKIEYIHYTDKQKLTKEEREELQKVGETIIKEGSYAVITLAGGQGTRLGHSGPKGTYPLTTKNGTKYIFEIIVDTLKQAQKQYGVFVPWYIMTSKENHQETVAFLKEHEYFGYPANKIKFFIQGELPLVNTQGKVILDKNKTIKEAADGNGGIYEAIAKSGYIEEMKQNNIQWVYISNVDNILANLVDALMVGLTIKQNQKIAAKAVAKNSPKEKVGVFCKVNGKPKVIEYIDLPEELAEQRDKNGELLYGEGNFGNYLLHRSVLENLADVKLPVHAAFKKSAYLNEQGEYIEPQEPNAYKFEAFIFDVFARYDDITVFRVKREDEFAPVKNKTGEDSPKTAVDLYNAKF